jgi:hypothetical protein
LSIKERNYDNDGTDPSEEYFRKKKKDNDDDTYFPPRRIRTTTLLRTVENLLTGSLKLKK